jgi:hypothetical protein
MYILSFRLFTLPLDSLVEFFMPPRGGFFLPATQAVIKRSWSGDILCPGRGLDTRNLLSLD